MLPQDTAPVKRRFLFPLAGEDAYLTDTDTEEDTESFHPSLHSLHPSSPSSPPIHPYKTGRMRAEEVQAEEEEEQDPLLRRLPVEQRALMLAMRRADAMPDTGQVTIADDAACQRRRVQFAILRDAWRLLAPDDKLSMPEMSKWLHMVIREEGEGCEGEFVLDEVFAFFGAPHPNGVSFPKRAVWTSLYNSLHTTPLPRSTVRRRGQRP